MKEHEYTKFGNDLDALSRRIEVRYRELNETGRFAGAHAGTIRDIRAKELALRNRVSAAVDDGGTWELIKAELVRDYSSLFDNVVRFERQIDVDFDAGSKSNPPRSSS